MHVLLRRRGERQNMMCVYSSVFEGVSRNGMPCCLVHGKEQFKLTFEVPISILFLDKIFCLKTTIVPRLPISCYKHICPRPVVVVVVVVQQQGVS